MDPTRESALRAELDALQQKWPDLLAWRLVINRRMPDEEQTEVTLDIVTPGYFQAVGTPLVAGRDFGPEDRSDDVPVAIVNQAMVKRYWPDEDPIGQRFRFGGPESGSRWWTVVGVAGDARRTAPDREAMPSAYLSHRQNRSHAMMLLIRSGDDPLQLAGSVREAVRELDPNLPVAELTTLDAILGERLALRRLSPARRRRLNNKRKAPGEIRGAPCSRSFLPPWARSRSMIQLPRPRLLGGAIEMVAAPPSPDQAAVAELVQRAERIRNGGVNPRPRQDNMLAIATDGRKVALDMRVLNSAADDFAERKVNLLVERVLAIWTETRASRLTQLIFCDLSKPVSPGRGFSVYNDVREKLIARDVPPAEIAFIHDAGNDVKKARLFTDLVPGGSAFSWARPRRWDSARTCRIASTPCTTSTLRGDARTSNSATDA